MQNIRGKANNLIPELKYYQRYDERMKHQRTLLREIILEAHQRWTIRGSYKLVVTYRGKLPLSYLITVSVFI